MPIYMEISRLTRTVMMVARGPLTVPEIEASARALFDARVPQFGKVIDISAARARLGRAEVQRVADILRGDSAETRGPLAFIIDPNRADFGHAFVEATQGESPVRLFRSLHAARDWLRQAPWPPAPAGAGTLRLFDGEMPSPRGERRQSILVSGDCRHKDSQDVARDIAA